MDDKDAETARLKAVRSLGLLDTPPEERFDRLTRLAAGIFKVSFSCISLVDERRVWFKSRHGGGPAGEVPREDAFCSDAIAQEGVFVVEDAARDPRYKDRKTSGGFYAGCPLRAPGGERVGTLCLRDPAPRRFNGAGSKLLAELAALAESELRCTTCAHESDQALLRRALQFELVAALGLRALREGERADLLQGAIDAVVKGLGVECAGIWEALPEGGCRLVSGQGWEAGQVGALVLPPGRGCLPSYAMESQIGVVSTDLAAEKRFTWAPATRALGLRSGIGVVIAGGDRAYGALTAHARSPRAFSPDDVGFLQSVANVLAAERVRALGAKALGDSEAKFRQIAENINEVFWMTDPQKQEMLYISPAYETVWGRSRQSLYVRPSSWLEAIHPDDAPRVARAALETQAGGLYDEEYRILRPDGSLRWIRDRAFPIRDESGAVTRIVGIAEDITAFMETQAALLGSEEKLRQAAKMEAVGRLAGGVAHDFNNLLMAIEGSRHFIAQELPAESPQMTDVDNIAQAVKRASSLTRQLLAFSRHQTMRPKPTSLSASLEAMRDLLRRLLPEDIRITLEAPEDLPAVLVDPTQLDQVILNLALNARDAMPQGGALRLRTFALRPPAQPLPGHAKPGPGPWVCLSVSDTGEGMAPDLVQKIFEPFFTTKELGRGTGLGLATVYGIVMQSGGSIAVHSAPGAGTEFEILFPEHAGQAVPQADVPEPRIPGSGSETILLVDDDAVVRRLVKRALSDRGFRVLDAGSRKDAAALMAGKDLEIDLLLTDVVLPDATGTALAADFQRRFPRGGVLFMSGYPQDMVAEHGGIPPSLHLIDKPFSIPTLIRSVHEALARSRRDEGPSGPR